MALDLTLLKKLREETGISISECRQALEEAEGNYDKALTLLKAKAEKVAAKKADRETGQGIVETYVHGNGKIGVMVMLLCETDFVAKTDEFKHLGHEIAMQVAAMDPKDVEELLKQEYIKDPSVTIEKMVKEAIQKTGENIIVKKFERFAI
ncbi:MAG TPA: elongation factor Ts [Candidatus Eisenbacteria bacterium]|nr:elongation factor Ts [Candidatus Eisenbacteria bacterium]